MPALTECNHPFRRVDSPPTQMGRVRFLGRLGSKMQVTIDLDKFPPKRGVSFVQTSFMTAIYSRVRGARSAYGTPSNSNSSAIQPTPAPKITRPPDATSSEATTRAISNG